MGNASGRGLRQGAAGAPSRQRGGGLARQLAAKGRNRADTKVEQPCASGGAVSKVAREGSAARPQCGRAGEADQMCEKDRPVSGTGREAAAAPGSASCPRTPSARRERSDGRAQGRLGSRRTLGPILGARE